MKRLSSFCSTLLLFGIICTGCISGCTQQEETPTYETLLKEAYGPRITSEPDTLALGFYWGMSGQKANEHMKSLAQSKKVTYKNRKGYVYPIPLTHYSPQGNIIEDYIFRVSYETYNNTIKELHLKMKGSDNNHSGYTYTTRYNDLTVDDVYKQFGPIFEGKGYVCKQVDVERELKTDSAPGIPRAHWKGIEYRFVKGNTFIRIWRGADEYDFSDILISYYDLSVICDEQKVLEEKASIEANIAAEKRQAKEKEKQESLTDF